MIRAITVGIPLFSSSTAKLGEQLTRFRAGVNAALEKIEVEPRTIRITLPPAPADAASLSSILRGVDDLATTVGARWYCLPIDLLEGTDRKEMFAEAAALITRNSKLFVNLIVADEERISIDGANRASEFVLNLARRSSSGLDCFRLGISARCPAGAPFFPFSRHEGGDPAFSIAMETTATALRIAKQAKADGSTLQSFQQKLANALATDMATIDALGEQVADDTGLSYRGLDASFAPFPDGETSVAKILELLGPTPAGSLGSVFATSVLTDTLGLAAQKSGARLTGFNGVMYSVLEDEGLAHANDLRALSLSTLAVLSAVCGCGIDMVPVPSTMYQEELAGLILDTAALAVRLNKPLGVRVLPIPNRMVNERTQFNLDFLCDSRVMNTGVSASKPLPSEAIWRYGSTREKK